MPPTEVSTLHAHSNGTMHVNGGKDWITASFVNQEQDSASAFKITEVPVFEVDSRDIGTPDDWIKRHPALVRLTGRHPFNCEPPLPELMKYGFLTPTSLHYVRSHGIVPRVPVQEGDDWTVDITGLVEHPQTLTVGQIKSLPSRTLPVTLVCAGNRRKEVNMVKQSKGFNWGAAGISTSIWKGVLLSDVLKLCGILPRSKGALHVCFEGAETLPGGGGSKYGTSLKREIALDPAEDVILAYEQNGKSLEPDHGFPIRMIIPGFIGGRMVKWLTKIEVTSVESDNFYHFHDNRVFPSHVDAEIANQEGWWFKPTYIINQLNINSCITTPAQGQVLTADLQSSDETFRLQGYCYTGGGREIIRAEVSLNNGVSWDVAELTFHETPTEYGRYWCWVFWSLEIKVSRLMEAKEIVCRAWDAAQNTQPQFITWNLMGMMNNSWFRVKIHKDETEHGKVQLKFEHPTRPGNESGGWMERSEEIPGPGPLIISSPKPEPERVSAIKTEPEPLSAAKIQKVEKQEETNLRGITMEEMNAHDNEDSAWILVNGKVYDCTKFLDDHPGGADSILMSTGMDATDDFEAIHSSKAHTMLEEYLIGVLVKESNEPTENGDSGATEVVEEDNKQAVTLDPKNKVALPLIEKEELSHDTRRFRFGLPSENHVLGLPVGKHVFLSAKVNGKSVMRAYTPTSTDSDKGFMDLVIKVYRRGVVPEFPQGGLMSQHLDELAIGDSIEAKGPMGHIEYKGNGTFQIGGKERHCKQIALLAGGTGITPVFQVIQAVLSKEEYTTEVWLLYCNRTEEDILLRSQLDSWADKYPNLHVWYTIDKATKEDWKYSTGRINEEMMRTHLPPSSDDTFAFICGPPGMVKYACIPNLKAMGYDEDNIFTF